MNRFFRRFQRFGKRSAEASGDAPTYPTNGRVQDAGTLNDVASTRAKSSRHKKSTADHWNQ